MLNIDAEDAARDPSALDATFAALADSTRRAIVARLTEGDASVLELAEPFPISLPAISRHLKVLETAGLITRSRNGQRRPCSLRAEALEEVAAWAEHTRGAWEERFDRLDDYLRSAHADASHAPREESQVTRDASPVDERARQPDEPHHTSKEE